MEKENARLKRLLWEQDLELSRPPVSIQQIVLIHNQGIRSSNACLQPSQPIGFPIWKKHYLLSGLQFFR